MNIYLLQFDTPIPYYQFLDIVEKLGDFCIYKDKYIVNTKISKLKIKNKFNKVLNKNDQIFVKEIKEDELENLPFIVKDWFYKNLHKQNNSNIAQNTELIKQDVLKYLNTFIDTIREELDNQRKEE